MLTKQCTDPSIQLNKLQEENDRLRKCIIELEEMLLCQHSDYLKEQDQQLALVHLQHSILEEELRTQFIN